MAVETPFDLVNSILESKSEIEFTETITKLYSPFLTNRSLSYNIDTLPYAVELNRYKLIDPEQHYVYLFRSVRKFKRQRSKWFKKVIDESVDVISRYYECSHKKAADIRRGTTDDQLNKMKAALDEGGSKK